MGITKTAFDRIRHLPYLATKYMGVTSFVIFMVFVIFVFVYSGPELQKKLIDLAPTVFSVFFVAVCMCAVSLYLSRKGWGEINK